jgi:putative addiction module component (TIGR02574 family)
MAMSRTYEEVRADALTLSEEDRVALLDSLNASLMPAEQFDPEFRAGLDRRLEELVSGRVQGVPIDEAIANARAALSDARGLSSGRLKPRSSRQRDSSRGRRVETSAR